MYSFIPRVPYECDCSPKLTPARCPRGGNYIKMERNLRLTFCLSAGPSRKWLAMLNGGPAPGFALPPALALLLAVPLSLPRSTGKRLPISCYALHSLSYSVSLSLSLSFCLLFLLFTFSIRFFYSQIAASLHDSVCAACSLSRGVYCACSAHVSMSNSQEQKTNNQ